MEIFGNLQLVYFERTLTAVRARMFLGIWKQKSMTQMTIFNGISRKPIAIPRLLPLCWTWQMVSLLQRGSAKLRLHSIFVCFAMDGFEILLELTVLVKSLVKHLEASVSVEHSHSAKEFQHI